MKPHRANRTDCKRNKLDPIKQPQNSSPLARTAPRASPTPGALPITARFYMMTGACRAEPYSGLRSPKVQSLWAPKFQQKTMPVVMTRAMR